MTPSPDTSQSHRPTVDDMLSSTPAIETHGLSKHFGQRKAVDGLTISIPAGTIAGFVGPNGAGKTTTIRLLLGLVRPGAGSATILGQPLAHPERYLPRVGALIEAPAFYPSLSGRTNLEVLAHLGGHPRSRVGQLLEAEEATQLDLVARIASAAGYTVTPDNGSVRIACPLDWASELDRRAREAGATRIAIHAKEASLEERFLAMVKGDH